MSTRSAASRSAAVLAGAVAVEAVVVLVATGYLLNGLVTQAPTERTAAIWLTICAGVLGAGLLALVLPLARGRSWARGPAITWQLLQLPVAFSMAGSQRWYLGVPLLVIAVIALVVALRERAREAVTPPR